MARYCSAECLNENASHLLCLALIACRKNNECIRLKAELGNNLVLLGSYELGNASDDLAVLIHSEPVSLAAGLDLAVCHRLVDELAALVEVRDNYRLDLAFCKRCELFRSKELRNVCNCQVDSKVRLVCTILLHCLKIRNAHKRRT